MSNEALTFKVRPRILRHLGEQLIRDSSLAVFELVKNAYDADAEECIVILENPTIQAKARIIVEDNGDGMTADLIRKVWMVIATEYRERQRKQGQRTPKFHRYPLGEKGLGRLAIHKLGRQIKLVTRVPRGDEVVLEFDWNTLEKAPDLEHARINLQTRTPVVFKGKKKGTRIEVSDLRERWTRRAVRDLHRSVTSLRSPFPSADTDRDSRYAAITDFDVQLRLEPGNDWLDGLLDAGEVRKCALYHARGSFEGNGMVFDYTFTPPRGTKDKLKGRRLQGRKFPLQRRNERKVERLDLSPHKIGKVLFDFYIFDRELEVMRAVTEDIQGLRRFLNDNGGIRIYREGIRVYDFGEPGNDWLNLDVRRVNRPVARVSNNQILGALMLSAEQSSDLIEKSNREGFLENEPYDLLMDATISVLTQVEAERQKDQKSVRHFYSRGGSQKSVFDSISELREALDKRGVLPEVEKKLIKVEKQLEQYRETMVRAAVPGLTFGVMIHGAEKLLNELVKVARTSSDIKRIRVLIEQLNQTVFRIGNLLRGSGSKVEKASALVEQAFFNAEFRFESHHIERVNGMKLGNPDFAVKVSRRLIMGTLNNLIDNSIYWLKFNKPTVKKRIFVGTSNDIEGGPCLIVADTGPGFQDSPEILTQPFFSRRVDDGMGLGLYLAADVMRLHEGKLLFPSRGDVALPREFKGAIIALQFPIKSS